MLDAGTGAPVAGASTRRKPSCGWNAPVRSWAGSCHPTGYEGHDTVDEIRYRFEEGHAVGEMTNGNDGVRATADASGAGRRRVRGRAGGRFLRAGLLRSRAMAKRRTRKEPLAGKVALVTGAGKRIGRAIAIALARAGADVVVHANRSRGGAEEVARRVRALGRRAAVVTADLADRKACAGLVAEAVAALGRVDVLVNNAAIFGATPPMRPDAGEFDRFMAVNARAVYVLTGEAGRRMARGGGGVVVNVACASASRPWPGYLPYSASKAAVVALTKGFAKALAPKVRVNAVAPGPILPAKGASAARNRAAIEATLLRRWGRAEDVAAAVVHLATSPFTTGAVLPVDGGRDSL